jgi:hypothetical protein
MLTAKQAKERTENYYFNYIDSTITIAADNGQANAKAYVSEDIFTKVKDSYRDLGFTISYAPDSRTMFISWSNIAS